jgi:membrane-bound lytic murein transglycosylase B
MTALLALLHHALAAPLPDAFVAEVAAAGGLDPAVVRARLEPLQPTQSVLDRMASPWEAKPWHTYRTIFLTEARIQGGRDFRRLHADTLDAASRRYGVPPEVIVAILGVETSYGTKMGSDPVIDALFTLGFHHPKRGPFFRKELGHYLRLEADEGWSGRVGSYAGAMGMGQFMPSSYRNWAVDFDADGKRDLFGSPADAIGSVANYFAQHGWKGGAHLLVDATVPADLPEALRASGLELDRTVGELRAAGVVVPAEVSDGERARLLRFETSSGEEWKVALHDFYVITRYNHSPLYARAVWGLAQAIAAP